jgi:Domain of unknown function (DUF1841)
MLFGQSRDELRQVYFKTWKKYQDHLPLEPLEKIIAEVIVRHPEYHPLLQDQDSTLTRDYLPEAGESNPFLHMGMHIGIHEQLTTDRPAGIRSLYQQLLRRHQDAHAVEHMIMECLAEMIWQAQRNKVAPDEVNYLACLQKRV